MTAQTRAAVWIDHHEARIFHVDLASFDEQKVKAPHHHFHRHPKGSSEHEHPDDEQRFFREVTEALRSADEIMVMGPSTAKSQLLKHWEQHARALKDKVVTVETSDHPTDAQIVAHVRQHFRIPISRV
jgi:stalled ribosome rescue protein Dom34